MTGSNEKILAMIKERKSIEEISNEMNLSYKQLFYRFNQLQGHGYNIDRTYNTNGNIGYSINGKSSFNNEYFELYNGLDKVKIMAISDIHMGNVRSDEEALNTIYNYCIKNNIHVIVICGDLIEGKGSGHDLKIPAEDQIEHFIKTYPFDKSIINLYSNGNHEKNVFDEFKMSLNTALLTRRHDICPIRNHKYITSSSINDQIIKINNNKIAISHINPSTKITSDNNIKLHLMGHRHASVSLFNVSQDKTPYIFVPSITRQNAFNQMQTPRAVELEIHLEKNKEFRVIDKKDLIILNERVLLTCETIINYSDKDIKPFRYTDQGIKSLDMLNNQDEKAKEEKHILSDQLGKLNEDSKKKLEAFYSDADSQKNINVMLKEATPSDRHSYK